MELLSRKRSVALWVACVAVASSGCVFEDRCVNGARRDEATGRCVLEVDDAGARDASTGADGGAADGGPADGGRRDAGALDAGPDAGPPDAGPPDAGPPDAGPPPPAPRLRWPTNGAYTGSIHVPVAAAVVDHPLRPKLMWEPVDRAVEYQVQLDDCGSDLFRTCAFASPEVDARTPGEAAPSGSALSFRPASLLPVSAAPPVGRRYVWRVRACDAVGCGAWSEPRYLNVGRHPSDFDGDGYADLAVGASGQGAPESDEGNAFVFYGGPAGVGSAPSVTLDNPADQVSGFFGQAVAGAGDLNGDGYADLVVGAQRQDAPETDEGNVFVYYGGESGIGTEPSVTLDNPTDNPNAYFGWTLAGAGDLDGDGYGDLVVGAYSQENPESNEGNAFVYYGAAGGVGSEPDVTLDNPGDQDGGFFGVAVAGAGDLNGDGCADLVVGALGYDNPESNEGNAFVYHGDPAGVSTEPDITLDNPGDQELSSFGDAVAGPGDLDGDGFADLVVSDHAHDAPESNEGNAFVYYGGAGGVPPDPDLTLDNPADQAFGDFGRALAGGDLNGDGLADLVVGADGQEAPTNGEGNAFVYLGAAGGLAAEPSVTLDNPSGSELGSFGVALASGDLNGDGFVDLIVGADGQSDPEYREGAVFIYFGAEVVPDDPDLGVDNPADQEAGFFGRSVASAADLRRGGSSRRGARRRPRRGAPPRRGRAA